MTLLLLPPTRICPLWRAMMRAWGGVARVLRGCCCANCFEVGVACMTQHMQHMALLPKLPAAVPPSLPGSQPSLRVLTPVHAVPLVQLPRGISTRCRQQAGHGGGGAARARTHAHDGEDGRGVAAAGICRRGRGRGRAAQLGASQLGLLPSFRVRALDSDFAPASVRLQVTVRLQLTVRLQVWCQAHP